MSNHRLHVNLNSSLHHWRYNRCMDDISIFVPACLKAKSWGHLATCITPTRLKQKIIVDHQRCHLIGDHEVFSYPAPIPHVGLLSLAWARL
ncbi:hypothetical protein ASPFODRAFT_678783 [Aspergillus luchuensis CBS 106.47]|uniref:Uncharacterized protein n=1 Tax=Aspergillus luchuensis (strain CBS 106.47) TaxID=1137211 RepID=A0A1M3TCB8_ASPLC|nr:hypothetical protein ASPFODRAFT_678783 [Aspergillus luchuensis CBS 106.47]